MSRVRGEASLFGWMSAGELRAHPARSITALVAIAVGVALGFAVQLVNRSAVFEFAQAVRASVGEADLELRGIGLAARQGFDDHAFDATLGLPGLRAASPLVELEARVHASRLSPREPLRIVGIDPWRAIDVNPGFIGRRDASASARGSELEPFDERAIYLSTAALAWLRVAPGEPIDVERGADATRFIVAGTVPGAAAGQRIAIVDIAAAQSLLGRDGRLTSIALRLEPGTAPEALRAAMQDVPALRDLVAVEPAAGEARASSLSRAYRVNLDVLAMVALVTGGFLVFSMQALAVVRRRPQFALLRVLGWRRAQLLRLVLVEGALIGVAGGVLGVGGGGLLALFVLDAFGGDLGGGYFTGSAPALAWSWPAASVYLLLGMIAASLGSLAPALEAARAHPARALRSGDEEGSLSRGHPLIAVAGLVAGVLAAFAPAWQGVPVMGYASMALLLVATIALMPTLTRRLARAFARRMRDSAVVALALGSARVANAPAQSGIVLAGVLASFSLVVAMAIMVASFRSSVDAWLAALLPADLYVRSGTGGDAVQFPVDAQARIAQLPGVGRVEASRFTQVSFDPARPGVALIARDLGDGSARDVLARLPLRGAPVATSGEAIYVSEAMLDLYGWRLGEEVELPLRDRASGQLVTATIAGVWRDYARQFGSIVIARDAYRRLSGDDTITDLALWLAPGASASQVTTAVRGSPGGERFDIASNAELRALSLRIFDRSFAVTYLLEAVAMLIGLFGVATAFGAQALARAREFGMLRHLGIKRREILLMLALEGTLLTAVAVVVGLALGFALSLVLIDVVNPQSFHWTMDLRIPWRLLAVVSLALLACAAATAALFGRAAAARSAVLAVREDW